jgi:phosphoglycolate phosphatase-like HAD superfamily hydrolase
VTGAVAVDLDGALGDTHGLWDAFLADAARRFHSIAELDVVALPADRGAAAAELDRWAARGVGDWRGALERFAEDHAPVYVRPNARANGALRSLAAGGVTIGVFTDAPLELARVTLAHLGAGRRIDALETGAGSRERLLERLAGRETAVAETEDDLVRIGTGGAKAPR